MTLDAGRATRERRRRLVAGAILALWGLGVIALVRREYAPDRAAVFTEAALRLPPGALYFRVEQDGRQIGFASTTIDTTGTGFEVVDYFVADLPVADRAVRAGARSVATLSRGLSLRTFDVEVDTPDATMHARGTVDGDSAIHVFIRTGGMDADTLMLDVKGPILIPTLLPAAAVLVGAPKVGRTLTVASFDPRTLAPADVQLRITAESLFVAVDSARLDPRSGRWVAAQRDTVQAWRVEGGSFLGWVDANGGIVASEQPGGITLRRTAYELAFENWRLDRADAARSPDRASGEPNAARPGDLFERTAIAAGVQPTAAGDRRFAARLRGVSLAGFDLHGGRQTLSGDTLRVTREDDALLVADWSLASRSLPFRERFVVELADEPMLQVHAPEITALAVRIAGTDRDPAVVARRITAWVHDSLTKTMTVNIPNARQVLRTRRGDCNEHTQLFVALARAAGIPARIAAGLTLVDGRFYYHAWPEVYLRDWVAVDPTFGQFPASATHLRFIRGGLTRQTELLRLMGPLSIEPLNAP